MDLILGTAGHIDHGKTTLIHALTGVDTDRLPEEKRRGITIDLGFAELILGDYRLGIVDVPGHERLVRNMLAGATGFDVALLVVAADDSVKPQTREHLEILRLLDIPAGVIALTKCDVADDEWVDLVEQEVRELVAGTFLEAAPIVRTSAPTGEGLDEVRRQLTAAAAEAAACRHRDPGEAPFRLAIDRSFTVEGHGTVVTGSVVSGRAEVGDTLELVPGGGEVRVRGLRNHDRVVDAVTRGQRAAINLAGVHHDAIERGQELATPGYLSASRCLTVRIDLMESAPRPLKHRGRVRVHIGTKEVLASVSILDVTIPGVVPKVDDESELPGAATRHRQVEPGQTAVVQLFLAEPVVATNSQPLVLRSESPIRTIGGGHVLDPCAIRIRPKDQRRVRLAAELASGDPEQRVAAAVYVAGWSGASGLELLRTTGVLAADSIVAKLIADGKLLRLAEGDSPAGSGGPVVHEQTAADVAQRVAKAVAKSHDDAPLVRGFDAARIAQFVRRRGEPGVNVEAVIRWMLSTGQLVAAGRGVAIPGRGPELSKSEHKLLDHIIGTIQAAGLQPPSIKELQQEATKNKAVVPQLVALAEADGELVGLTDEIYLHSETMAAIKDTLEPSLRGEGLTVSEIREVLGTSRKYAVPLCEYLDRIGFTRRVGDRRVRA